MSLYYQPSGKVSVASILLFLLVGISIVPLVSTLYSLAIWFIPFIYLNFLITGLAGFLIGLSVQKIVIRFGKVRNVYVALLYGLALGLLASYFQWVVYTDLLMNAGDTMGNARLGITKSGIEINEIIEIAGTPSLVFLIIGELYEYGSWGIFGFTPSGIFLAIIWIIELLIAVLIPVIFARDEVKKPFCEHENKWFKEEELAPIGLKLSPQEFKEKMEMALQLPSDMLYAGVKASEMHLKLLLYQSEREESYLTAIYMRPRLNDAKLEFEEDKIFENLKITQQTANEIKALIV